MADVLAIVSKAMFEGISKTASVGQALRLDRYASTNKALEPLRSGGRLFLVTVRPPDERLWLIGVLDAPKHDGKAWVSGPCTLPIADITALRKKIRFTSGTGISAAKGALGMSLQTPRELTAGDVALLLGGRAVHAPAPAKKTVETRPAAPKAKANASSGGGAEIAAWLRDRDWSQAATALLALWKDQRSPELAALIERVSALQPAPDRFDLKAKHLAASLARLNEGVRFAESLKRIEALAKLPPDPRIAATLTGYILQPPFTAQSSRPAWQSIYDQLAGHHADPRTIPAVEGVADDYRGKVFGPTKMGEAMEIRARHLVETLRSRFGTVPSTDVRAWTSLLPVAPAAPARTKQGKPAMLDELLAQVYENPRDDDLRLVYADALMEAGDPRGEFIALQFKRHRGEASADDRKREEALFKVNARTWLGPVYDVLMVNHTTFDRGFFAKGQIRPVGKGVPAARDHAVWSTCVELSMAAYGTDRGAGLITAPSCRHLRALSGVTHDEIDALAATAMDRDLEELEISWIAPTEDDEHFREPTWSNLLGGKGFPKLKRLYFGVEAAGEVGRFAELWNSPVAQDLEAIRFVLDGQAWITEAVKRTSAKRRIELTWRGALLRVLPDLELAVERLELGRRQRRSLNDDAWTELLSMVPRVDWKRVTLRGDIATEDAVRSVKKRLKNATVVVE